MIDLEALGYRPLAVPGPDMDWVGVISPDGELVSAHGMAVLTPVPKRLAKSGEHRLVFVGPPQSARAHAMERGEV